MQVHPLAHIPNRPYTPTITSRTTAFVAEGTRMARTTARVDGATLVFPERDATPITVDTDAWFAWLEAASTKRFGFGLCDRQQGCIVGRMTVRKDGRQRGGWYWSVFRRQGGRLRRLYLGKSSAVTRARLEQIAAQLLAEGDDQIA